MRYVLCILFILLNGCKEKEFTPVGKTYRLIQSEQPIEISLTFDQDGRFYGKAVNKYFGVYQINGSEINLNLQGQTMIVGPSVHMAFEDNYFKSLRSIKTFKINDNILILNGNINYIFKLSDMNE